MLRQPDCVMIKVANLAAAEQFYVEVMGLTPRWRDARSVALALRQDRGELVLHRIEEIPSRIDVRYCVADVSEAALRLTQHGCRLVAGPFPIAAGHCAVIRDSFGAFLTLEDASKALREAKPAGGSVSFAIPRAVTGARARLGVREEA